MAIMNRHLQQACWAIYRTKELREVGISAAVELANNAKASGYATDEGLAFSTTEFGDRDIKVAR